MFSSIRRSLNKINEINVQHGKIAAQQHRINNDILDSKLLTGKLIGELNENKYKNDGFRSLNDYEFKVFSQFGDDGIIQFLINRVQPDHKTFIEFGVSNYDESNTKFLLLNNNWKGLIFDGDKGNIQYIKQQEYFWRHYLIAEAYFVTRENINSIIRSNGFVGRVGLLHVDLDGNDYWIWKVIECVSPDILILEYNSVFGKDNAWTIPYKSDFNRTDAHYSNLYWGASLKALSLLSAQKGFSFVGCNNAGNNAYYIRNEIIEQKQLQCLVTDHDTGFKDSHFRESRDENYQLTFLAGDARFAAIKGCPVFDVQSNQTTTIP
jgi:hypothetical protein